MLYGTASGDQFGVSQACLTDAFIGHAHVYAPICPAIRHASIYPCFCPCFCCVFTGFEDAVRHRLWGSIWHALGSNSAGVPLFRKHASRTRSSAMSTYVPICPAIRHARIYPCFCPCLLCFYGFRRCCTAPPLGINLARLGLEFCWGSAVSQACLTDAFIGHVHLRAYMSSYPPCAYISMLLSMFAVFLRVSKMLYGTASGDEFVTPWARILLGFRCFASMPHGRVHRPCPPIRAYVQLSAMRLLLLCVYGF